METVTGSDDGKFLLTHPVWDVTNFHFFIFSQLFMSTHTSRVGCDFFTCSNYTASSSFLLTHPVWDVTKYKNTIKNLDKRFLLTHPVWDVTKRYRNLNLFLKISTHTSRVGCDLSTEVFLTFFQRFLLTHPVWDVTYCINIIRGLWTISTHTSRVGCDLIFLHSN